MTNELLPLVAGIADQLPDPIIWVKPVFRDGSIIDFQIEYSNEQADKSINHPKGSLKGLLIRKDGVPSSASSESNYQHFLEVYTSGEEKEFQFYAHHSNKEFETLRKVFMGGVLSAVRDRRAQREAEKKEREQAALIKAIIDNSPVGIEVYEAVRDEAGQITDFQIRLYNKVLHQLTGISEADRNALTFKELLKRVDSEAMLERYVHTVQTGEPFSFEFYSPLIKRWMNINTVKLGDGFLILLTDITELKNLQQDVEKLAEKLMTIVNASEAGLFTLKPVFEGDEVVNFRFGIVNQAVASYVGATAEQLSHSLADQYFAAYKSNGLFEKYRHTYLTGEPLHFDFHYEDNYDVFLTIDVKKMDGEILITFTDHTKLKRLQRELENKLKELERSNVNLEEFAYAASHDLKEPIRKVQYFAERLKDRLAAKLNEEEQHIFSRMENATARMGLLIDDLLSYSQVSLRPKVFEQVDLNQLLDQVLSDLELLIHEQKAEVISEKLPVVQGHARQLNQLFHNLVGNGLKYRKPDTDPQIRIHHSIANLQPGEDGSTGGRFHCIEIADNGIGFDQKDAERIFQVFQRLHGNTEYKGTGVGLAIARKVAENHNGFIRATGKAGEGARFSIYLPAE